MDVCPRVSVLCCPVSVEALRWADPPAKASYQMSLYVDQEAHYGRPKPVSIAERSKASTLYDRLNIEIAGSNAPRGMDVCLRVSVLCCPVFR
jgi:hypothetical protein